MYVVQSCMLVIRSVFGVPISIAEYFSHAVQPKTNDICSQQMFSGFKIHTKCACGLFYSAPSHPYLYLKGVSRQGRKGSSHPKRKILYKSLESSTTIDRCEFAERALFIANNQRVLQYNCATASSIPSDP